ncbi:MAG: indole-3-glycerol-phosphate synthase [Candidatus Freyarchaeota archaeon]|nr:indole-3-glycerol-phosphate synthase [Candidatus Jordarchaeia archaeon]MBS7267599.1 indole-3-glycerol-phosphate synthase [Candidatus Jordarchaeia archaeon]
MPDYIDSLANEAAKRVEEGYYKNTSKFRLSARPKSLREAVLGCTRAPIISEVKFASPSSGVLREYTSPGMIARDLVKGGSVGVSVLTEPKNFGGKLDFVGEIRSQVSVPILMKDIILSSLQIEAAYRSGADAVLLIQALFDRGYCEEDVQSMIGQAHSFGLEVLLESHSEDEFLRAVKTAADLVGINNRDLKTLTVNLEVTKRILARHRPRGKVVVSESGISTPQDIRYLRECGAQAFLVGTSIMKSNNIREKVAQLVESI